MQNAGKNLILNLKSFYFAFCALRYLRFALLMETVASVASIKK